MTMLHLRAASAEDAALLWGWANDPVCRKNAFDSNPIEWESHIRWLEGKLAAPDCRIWILEMDGAPVGQVRYDRTEFGVEIDFAIAAEARGLGLGTKLLKLSAPRAHEELQVERLIGFVKSDNPASIRAFERAGFVPGEAIRRDGKLVLKFEHARE